ncbi:Hypothetical predicted protein, partial [Pelobates cultripes]
FPSTLLQDRRQTLVDETLDLWIGEGLRDHLDAITLTPPRWRGPQDLSPPWTHCAPSQTFGPKARPTDRQTPNMTLTPANLTIISINVRGLNKPKRRSTALKEFHSARASIVYIQETHTLEKGPDPRYTTT